MDQGNLSNEKNRIRMAKNTSPTNKQMIGHKIDIIILVDIEAKYTKFQLKIDKKI